MSGRFWDFGMWGVEFEVEELGKRICRSQFRIEGLGLRIYEFDLRLG